MLRAGFGEVNRLSGKTHANHPRASRSQAGRFGFESIARNRWDHAMKDTTLYLQIIALGGFIF
jgi:hypothetical protein